ncbi:MAG: aspartate kinase [Candidatus Bathyarchaeia archaeon]
MILVMKFGGTALKNAVGYLSAAEAVRRSVVEGCQVIAVASAMEGMTERLRELGLKASNGAADFTRNSLKDIHTAHVETLKHVGRGMEDEAKPELRELIGELEKAVSGILYLREFTPRSMDYFQSFGDRFSSIILEYALNAAGLKAKRLTGGECGILTDDRYGDAKPLMEVSRAQIEERLKPLLAEGFVPVVAGSMGQTQEGYISTLGPGGADYAAMLIASAVGAHEVWIWSGVDGLMTADPAIEPEAKVIPNISYEEALEMAFFGAKILHPKAIRLAERFQIPVKVKNLLNPDAVGSEIASRARRGGGGVVKAVTIIRDVALISIEGAGTVDASEVVAKTFAALSKLGVHVLMISQGSSQSNISLIIPGEELGRTVSGLELTLTGSDYVKNVSFEQNLCVLAVVGEGMKGTPGVAARVFKAVAEKGINVRMIAQGSSEANISFAVQESDGEEAVKALHREFKLHETC